MAHGLTTRLLQGPDCIHLHPSTGEDHFLLESKKPMCLRPRNEIAAVTFFAKNCAALTKSNTLASVTEWQDSGEHGC